MTKIGRKKNTNGIVRNLKKWMLNKTTWKEGDIGIFLWQTWRISLWNLKCIFGWNFQTWTTQNLNFSRWIRRCLVLIPSVEHSIPYQLLSVISIVLVLLFLFWIFRSLSALLWCGFIHFIAVVLITNKFRFNFHCTSAGMCAWAPIEALSRHD